MRVCRFVQLTALVAITGFVGLSLRAQDTFRPTQPPTSLALILSGPTLVRAGDMPRYHAFLVNNAKTDIQVPSSMLADGAILLEWKVVDIATQKTSTTSAGHGYCKFGEKFEQGSLVLKPGQKLKLTGIEVPDFFLRPSGKGVYRISLRYAPSAVYAPGDILQDKVQFSVISNQLTVVLSEN